MAFACDARTLKRKPACLGSNSVRHRKHLLSSRASSHTPATKGNEMAETTAVRGKALGNPENGQRRRISGRESYILLRAGNLSARVHINIYFRVIHSGDVRIVLLNENNDNHGNLVPDTQRGTGDGSWRLQF